MSDSFQVGAQFGPTKFKVEASAVAKFASAIGDSNPIYLDKGLVPPTFPASFFNLPLSYEGQVLHGEQEFSYVRPILVGEEITCTTVVSGLRELGDLGLAQLVVLETTGKDQNGGLVYTAKTTLIVKVG